MVNYYLVYGTSETAKESAAVPDLVSYYLVYRTSETERQRVAHRRMVNYCLITVLPKLSRGATDAQLG